MTMLRKCFMISFKKLKPGLKNVRVSEQSSDKLGHFSKQLVTKLL
jgi:hypothetical protein